MTVQEAIKSEPDLKEAMTILFEKFPRSGILEVEEYHTGDVFLKEGTPANKVFILLSGKTCAFWMDAGISQYHTNQLNPLTFIGDTAILADEANYTTSMKCLKRCRFFTISRQIFNKWLEEDRTLYKRLVVRNIRMLQSQSRVMRISSNEDKEMRILEYLDKQYVTRRVGISDTLVIKDKREQIATDVGALSLRTLNRYLSSLKEKGFISSQKGKICINKEQAKLINSYIQKNKETLGDNAVEKAYNDVY